MKHDEKPQVLGGGLGFRIGETVKSAGGAYRIRGFLGRGGMAQVLDVEDDTIGKRFALKILDRNLCTDPPNVERFEREARALGKLDHPHLVGVVRLERTLEEIPRPFFLMERLRGGTLRDHLNRGEIAKDRAVAIASELMKALDYVHDRKLLHRDVKPSNVFLHVDAFGSERVKLLDFGVMKLMLEDENPEGFFGTAHYAAPEQLEPGAELGPASDVYAAGIVLFETLTGTHPFATAERTPRGAREARKKSPPSLASLLPPGALDAGVTDELGSLLGGLLCADPCGRPSAGTASRALARIGRRMAEAHSEREESQIARTAVPLPFLPGHLAAPTLVDDPAQRRYPIAAYTVPMPPPEEKTEPISDSELLEPPPGTPLGRSAQRTLAHAPIQPAAGTPAQLDPRLAHAVRGRNISATVPLAQAFAHVAPARPEAAPRAVLPAEPHQFLPAGQPPTAESPPPNPGPSSTATTQVTLATKVLLALLVVLVVTLVGVFGGRPRHGHQAARVSAGGLAAGTSSPEPTGLALLTR